MPEKNTIRMLLWWDCNLRCTYCCNEIERFRSQFKEVTFDDIDFHKYSNVCVSGGEPLLYPDRLENVLKRLPSGKIIILYTNGIFLDKKNAQMLNKHEVRYANIGLHYPRSFDRIIQDCLKAVKGTNISLRFHGQNIYAEGLTACYPDVQFRFWEMDDCDRDNEERVVLKA